MATVRSRRWCVLLRGINVGGKNLIKMADLRRCLEDLGHHDVTTYIQSGNVLLTTPKPVTAAALTTQVAGALEATFGMPIPVAVIDADRLAAVVAEAPGGFGAEPDLYRYNVLFLLDPVTPAEVIAELRPHPEVDEAHAGTHAVYFRHISARASQSRLTRITQSPLYRSITIRNWNTTTKLASMVVAPD